MKISIFSQSFFSVSLDEAIHMTHKIGAKAIEIACTKPHLQLEQATEDHAAIMQRIKDYRLDVAALSLFSEFTNAQTVDQEVESAVRFIKLAPAFQTNLLKITPGKPGSANATPKEWDTFKSAIPQLIEAAKSVQVKLAVETHLRQLSDRAASTQQILDLDSSGILGVNLDFCNVAFGTDDPVQAIHQFKDRLYLCHIKNGYLKPDGSYDFRLLNDGIMDYSPVIQALRSIQYSGYLSIECLGEQAHTNPYKTAAHDFELLQSWL